MCLSTKSLLVAATAVAQVLSVNALSTNAFAARGVKQARDEKPNSPFDPNTTKYCSYWWDNDGSISCADMPGAWSISKEEFLRWNPSITSTCGNYVEGKSYCVEAASEPPVVTTGPTVPSTTTTTAAATTTTAGNGITTPTPIQPGMVSNCNKFYLVQSGDFCQSIADKSAITISQFTTWNPEVGGSSCSGLWADVYVCVGTTDYKPPATTTKPGNGIATPTPIQSGMTTNCKSFYFVKAGDSCAKIASAQKIKTQQFISWNPAVKSDCTGMFANTYACVAVL